MSLNRKCLSKGALENINDRWGAEEEEEEERFYWQCVNEMNKGQFSLYGDVPPYYREVYEAICCKQEDHVRRSVFRKLLNSTELPPIIQNQIAEIIESKDESITKSALYRALVLIALAQQGKQPSVKLLENVTQEYPKPRLGELESIRMQAQGNPILLSQSLQDLLHIDTVQVELIPEKKGLFLKHVEYELSSQRFKSSVYRRYNDFVVFHEVLLQRFPYRMVPALPPKRMLRVGREFIESRRRALKRFVNLVARHPFFSEDELLQIFLCFSGPVSIVYSNTSKLIYLPLFACKNVS
ncbi:hypothetical protein scyTo_0011619 [Scyliorhinus torazame]|uniref:PX domain-containing protein n=1 Tax=Scyliorhinus torazame TaxID=75743 RepID=A0A401NR89_SCYTO|nr:hypothetical protein [Scyliorhinus torazame]